MNWLNNLEHMCKIGGVEFKRMTDFHIQINSLHRVNIYPSTNSFYINGMVKKEYIPNGSPDVFLYQVARGLTEFDFGGDKASRKKLSDALKAEMYFFNPFCWVCGLKIETVKLATWEHKIPLSKGGSNRRDNLALSHEECNKGKADSIGLLKVDDNG